MNDAGLQYLEVPMFSGLLGPTVSEQWALKSAYIEVQLLQRMNC